jgi:hypothetical protein
VTMSRCAASSSSTRIITSMKISATISARRLSSWINTKTPNCLWIKTPNPRRAG